MGATKSHEEWTRLASALELPTHGFVDGGPVEAGSGKSFACFNPATGRLLASVTAFGKRDTDMAVQCAREAFEAGNWPNAPSSDRKNALIRLADLIEENATDLALMDSLSVGKSIEYTYTSDIPASASFLRWYAECIDKLYGEVAPIDAASTVTITREPIGVVGLITPWNYPLEEATMKIAPALAAGNSVVLKPPELSPFSAIRLSELAIEAGIPSGVLNVAPGLGETAGRALASHEDVDCIAFTGSTEVGKLLLQYSGDSNLKPVWLECGGKSPNIIFADCKDFDLTVREAARSVFRNKGEVCSAGTRIIVEKAILSSFLDALVDVAKTYSIGDPLDPETDLGPLASQTQFARVNRYIGNGVDEGATLLLDGRYESSASDGLYVGPTIFADVHNDMTIAQEEIFGPVIAVISFESEEEAVNLANGTKYGLAASIWTGDASRAHRLARAIKAGTVTVNGMDSQDVSVPFGGFKQSGIGREHSLHAFAQYTNVKTTWIHY